MSQTTSRSFFAPVKVPSLNDVLRMRGGRYGGHRYNADKRGHQEVIAYAAASIEPVRGPYRVRFHYYEQNKRRDPDNFTAVGRKYILDALVKSGKLDGDGWRHNHGMSDTWSVADTPGDVGVLVTIEPMELDND